MPESTRATFVVALFTLTLLSVSGIAGAAGPTTPPNVVLFIADDMSVKDSSAYGNKEIPAPNMAALAAEGLTFDRAYATSPTCAPSRAALLTGCYNLRNGAMWNQQRPRADIKKWPAYFKAMGYEVIAIGKVAHYGQVQTYGFDYAAFFNYHQDVCITKAVEWLAARKSDKPLCLLVGTNWPHVPWPNEQIIGPDGVTLPARIADTPETRVARTHYDTAVHFADRDLGEVRAAAKKYLPADTLFMFSADQGSQWPFSKWTLYEAGLHIPLIAVWPGHTKPGTRTSALVSWVDIMPTLLEAVGADPKTAAGDIDGRSFVPVLNDPSASARDRVFASHSGDGNVNFYPGRSVLLGEWKYIRNLDPKSEFHCHIDLKPQDTRYFPSWVEHAKTDAGIAALVQQYLHRPAEELYDVSHDGDELHNLSADPAHAAELAKARAALDEWMTASHDKGIASDIAAKPGNARIQRGADE